MAAASFQQLNPVKWVHSTIVIIMLSWIILLSSCAVFVRSPRYHDRGADMEHRDRDHGHDGRRD